MIILGRNPLKVSSVSCISCVLSWTSAFGVCVCTHVCKSEQFWWRYLLVFLPTLRVMELHDTIWKGGVLNYRTIFHWKYLMENQWPRGWRDSYLFGASFYRCLLYDWYGIISVHVLICMVGKDEVTKSINRMSLHQGHKKLSHPKEYEEYSKLLYLGDC